MNSHSPWMMALGMLWKAAFFFLLLLGLLRFMGKREVSSFTPLDLVVSIMLADAAVISIEDDKIPVLVGAVPVVTLAGLQIGMAWLTLKNRTIRHWVEGGPALLIRKGAIDEKALAQQRLNLDELLSNLRMQNIHNLHDVEYALIEPCGRLSVVPKGGSRPLTARDLKVEVSQETLPFAVVVDGSVNPDGLKHVGGDRTWLRAALEKAGVKEEDALVAMYDPAGKLFVQARSRDGKTEQPKTVAVDPPGSGGRPGHQMARGDSIPSDSPEKD